MANYRPRDQRRLDAGNCYFCNEPRGPFGTTRMCRSCANQARDKQRAKKGLTGPDATCLSCTQPRDNILSKFCRSCRKSLPREGVSRSINLSKIWRASGLCLDCGNTRLNDSTPRCLQHYLYLVSWNNTGGQVPWSTLRDLFDAQGGRCFYTGAPIQLGVNAELDHRKPRSRFPDLSASLANLVFCDAAINALKGTRTDDEFIAVCRQVAERFCSDPTPLFSRPRSA